MNEKEKQLVKDMLHTTEDYSKIVEDIKQIRNPLILHYFILNYNWDDGFEIPTAITNNKYCDLGTAILMIDSIDAFDIAYNPEAFMNNEYDEYEEEWKDFVTLVYTKIVSDQFQIKEISYGLDLTENDIEKLKLEYPNLNPLFFRRTPGKEFKL